jgi:hypothetical protein
MTRALGDGLRSAPQLVVEPTAMMKQSDRCLYDVELCEQFCVWVHGRLSPTGKSDGEAHTQLITMPSSQMEDLRAVNDELQLFGRCAALVV